MFKQEHLSHISLTGGGGKIHTHTHTLQQSASQTDILPFATIESVKQQIKTETYFQRCLLEVESGRRQRKFTSVLIVLLGKRARQALAIFGRRSMDNYSNSNTATAIITATSITTTTTAASSAQQHHHCQIHWRQQLQNHIFTS